MRSLLLNYLLGAVLLMLLWAGFCFVGTIEGWFHQPIAKEASRQSFQNAVDAELEKEFVGNFAMATLHHGTVEIEKFHSAGKPVNRHTVFQVASLSKWVSAVGIMKLVEEGKLDLDAPISSYLTRWQLPLSEFNTEEVTVRRLLSHTAGLTDRLGYSGFGNSAEVQSLEESLTKAADADEGLSGEVKVGSQPGGEFIYSGGGYTLLQLVVEEVTGQSFADYMRQAIFIPLGMKSSSYSLQDSGSFDLAEFYNKDGSKSGHYHYSALAATSLYTSLADLELFFQAHLKGKKNEPIGRTVIRPETLKEMRTPHGHSMGVAIWGLGTVLYATTEAEDFIIGHDGKSTPPINTAIRLNPETGDGIILLETGHPILATKLASEWVFWKTKKVDTFLFPMLIEGLIWMIGIGWAIILGLAVCLALLKRHQLKSR